MTTLPATGLAALIAQHFQNETGPLGIAVSGGSDSLALLHLMVEWGRAPLRCVTVDHRLRDASAEEAAQVAEICAALGIAHDTLTWDGWDGQGNLAAEARRARYALLADWAVTHGLTGIALGHTQDDIAETLLMRLARRAGVDGLAAMPQRRSEAAFQQDFGGVTAFPCVVYFHASLNGSANRPEIDNGDILNKLFCG